MTRPAHSFPVAELGLQPAVPSSPSPARERPSRQAGARINRGVGAVDPAHINALSIIAHDLRGPLASLSVLMELNQGYAEAEAWDRVAATADRALGMIDVLTGMLNGFLERARETGDPLSFRPAPVDLREVAAVAADLNRPIAEARDVSIIIEARGPMVAHGDRRLLIEAVENLVSNAVKYAREGGKVRCTVESGETGALVTVADDGPGLSEEDMGRAFRPFTRLSSHGTSRGPSCGLGLWIVRLIAERHGGSVTARSAGPGKGVAFQIALPSRRGKMN